MSHAESRLQLAPGVSQLPVRSYFDEKIFAIEMERFFTNGPGYVGHRLMPPQKNDWRSLEWLDHSHLLVNTGEGVDLVRNVCRHRQAIMLEGSGNSEHIVCPLHRWTYDMRGELQGAPHFAQQPGCHNLQRTPLEDWQGLLFRGPRSAREDLTGMAHAEAFDFSGYKLDRVELHECKYNWKTFIEVYLEDYHVVPFHPGLGQFVTCDDLSWQFGQWYSVQRVGITSLQQPGSPVYRRWHEAVRAAHDGKQPAHGAIWMAYYPNVMIEWYPQVLVVSTLIPRDLNHTTNVVEFYYPEEIVDFEREFVEAEQAAYMETAIEDDVIGERMDRGRYALLKAGINEVGPYQSPFEDGMQHFHEFYRKEMAGVPID
ncbi:MAG: aromatic ring-hydroxylating dioxygenase subunit alpha [Rhodocyclaceae bacterium]|nr:aromatic ring-hydroxylating dioxygenase subunit alpha [Rhodocyclaceae bacterium]